MTDHEQQPSAADIAREIRAQEAAEKKAKQEADTKKAGQGCLIFLGIALMVGLFIWLNSSGSTSTPAETIRMSDGSEMRSSRAITECREAIRNQLLAPSSAKFPGVFADNYPTPLKTGNSWRMVMHVDAQNAFGVMLPSVWDCEVDGSTSQVRVQER